MPDHRDHVTEFICAAVVPRDVDHASGTLAQAAAILATHPEVASSNIFVAAILGDAAAVRQYVRVSPASALVKGGPYDWDPLTHLCFSRYLKLDRARTPGFVAAATALLDAGASPNAGWLETDHPPAPTWESVLYGAAGIAHHAGVTRLLLERGGDPNDGETPYHTPESYDNEALIVMVESGRLNDDSLTTLLLRKCDWHDGEGIQWLLAHGADPNRMTVWGRSPFMQSVQRDNDISIIEAMLDRGGDAIGVSGQQRVGIVHEGISVLDVAVRRGRGDILALLRRRGIELELMGIERLIAACALADAEAAHAIARSEPDLVRALRSEGGQVLSEFAGVGNTDGVRLLLELGIPVDARYVAGDGYFGVARDSTALHVASWRARHDTVVLLIEQGADVNARDRDGRTPLMLAVRACVDSYWTARRSPHSIAALLGAGAALEGIAFPCGYDAADELLRSYRARA